MLQPNLLHIKHVMLRATTDGFLALSNHFILGGRFATVPNIIPKISGFRDILKEQLLA